MNDVKATRRSRRPWWQQVTCLRAIWLLGLLLVVSACAPGAPPLDTVAEPTPSLDAEQRSVLEASFQEVLEQAWAAARESDEIFPGATAAFILPDGSVSGFAVGFSDVEAKVPMTPDLRMPSGSIGKTYVSAVALALAREGKLDLDAPISEWLGDEQWFARLPNGNDITVRMLMQHASGLLDHAFESEAFADGARGFLAAGDHDRYFTPEELVGFVLDSDPLFPAGEGYHYTDTGYILLGLVLEKAAGARYYDELQRLFLDPLELESTLPQDRRQIDRLAQGYAVAGAQLFGIDEKIVMDDGTMSIHPLTEWTGGGLFNNPQDLVRWGKTLYEGEAMEASYLDELLQLNPYSAEASVLGYGHGVSVRSSEIGKLYGHGGFFPGYNSVLAYYPEHGFAVALQINTDQANLGHIAALSQVVYDALAAAQ